MSVAAKKRRPIWEFVQAACAGKARYESPQLAHKVAKRVSRKHVVVVYRCKVCGEYHHGTPNR
jgi:rubrerythrin